jgi:alkylation response protein AidB-like acyl-CoA dehydrogenase
VIVDGGYRVTGKWRFASGSANATWMGGHSTVFETLDKPRRDARGNPINRTMLFPRDQANIKDTWHVLGLRGTASNDYEVTDLFVREEYTTWRDSARDRRESGPLYNIPLLTLYGIGFSGVALGIAGSCLAAFMQLAQTKTSGGGLGSTAVLRDNAVIQSRVARACGRLESARAFLLQMLREIWTTSAASGALSLEQRARLRVAITGAMEAARKVVDFAYRAAGTTAIFEGSAFERRFRDLHTLLAQGQAHLSNFESAGQALFGIEPAQRL